MELFICPACLQPLLSERCDACQRDYQRVAGVRRFVQDNQYASNFGFQWKTHQKTQLDSFTGMAISHERFLRSSQWDPKQMAGEVVLECGSGAGRFTEVLVRNFREVYSFDLSEAVEANYANNGHNQNLRLFQASIYQIPILPESVDAVICLGVLQHTPDVEKTFHALLGPLRKGGRFCFDVYAAPMSYLHPRHLLRPFTRKMDPKRLYALTEKWVPRLLPLSNVCHKMPLVGGLLARMIPVANWRQNLALGDEARWLQWAILDTYDWLSAYYEQPVSAKTLKRWCEAAKVSQFEIQRYRGVYVVRGCK